MLTYSFVKPLLFRLIKQGAQSDEFSNVLENVFNRYQIYFQNKTKDTEELFALIFQ